MRSTNRWSLGEWWIITAHWAWRFGQHELEPVVNSFDKSIKYMTIYWFVGWERAKLSLRYWVSSWICLNNINGHNSSLNELLFQRIAEELAAVEAASKISIDSCRADIGPRISSVLSSTCELENFYDRIYVYFLAGKIHNDIAMVEQQLKLADEDKDQIPGDRWAVIRILIDHTCFLMPI